MRVTPEEIARRSAPPSNGHAELPVSLPTAHLPSPFRRRMERVLARVREVSQARRAIPALQTGDRKQLWVDDTLYVQARWSPGLDTAVVALAMGTSTRTARVPIPTALDLEGRTLVDHLGSGVTATVADGFADLAIPPWRPVILVPQ